MNLEGTKTQANLMAAFAGESEARNKYTYYASKAKKDGFVQISQLFTETANNEKEHAKIWFKLLHNGSVPDTATNLQDAATGENYAGARAAVFEVAGECGAGLGVQPRWRPDLEVLQLRPHRGG